MNHLSRATVLLSNSGVVSSGDLGLNHTQVLILGCSTDPQEALDNINNQGMVINIDKNKYQSRESLSIRCLAVIKPIFASHSAA